MPCSTADHAQLRDLVLEVGIDAPMRLHDRIVEVMGPAALEKLHRPGHVAISPAVRKPGDKELAEMTLAEEFAKLEAWHGLTAEIAEAAEDPGGFADESVTWRLGQAAEARNRALRAVTEDKTEYDTGQNGARINRDERDALNALLERINYAKPKR
jgi:DNA primase